MRLTTLLTKHSMIFKPCDENLTQINLRTGFSHTRANPKPPSQTDSLIRYRKHHPPWFLSLRFTVTA
ncbi:hypothetical protein L1987_49800 [Smallanthus sonchifolius]|uniref:Uncharacterized protein n=1 Tax=Smallanthus sonchifolius TaxID=185202 RepID=A0ACB9FWN9_9ASTR|nr:hypothetical protein L1987_49800 [Smallanthus sonchifolius]